MRVREETERGMEETKKHGRGGKAKHTIQSIHTAPRRNTQSRNSTSKTACGTVITSQSFCVQNKTDAQSPYFMLQNNLVQNACHSKRQ